MPMYQYSAKNLRGEEVGGTQEADSLEELRKKMYDKGYYLIKANIAGKEFSIENLFQRVGVKDFSVFCRQFATLLNAGVTILESIAVLEMQCENKKLKETLKSIHEQLLKGKMLSLAFKSHKEIFPEFFMNMVQVAEASGSLDVVLGKLAEYYEKENKTRKKIKSASTYPIIVSVLTVIVINIMMMKVIPMFANMLGSMGGELPLVTQIMMNVSDFMLKNALLILVANLGVVIGIVLYTRTENGRYKTDLLKLKLPLVKNIVIKSSTAKFSRSMGLLLKSGIPVVSAIDIMSTLIGNRFIEEKFKVCRNDIKEGRGIATSIKKLNIFPPMLNHMISVGESTGELDEMLTRTAIFYDEEVDEAIEQLTTMIEPIMIIIIAAIIGVVLLAIMLPMVSIMQNIK